jgi:hypothetical protein
MAGVCPPEVLATELDDLRVFGLGAFRAAVAHGIALAEHA